LCIYSGNGGFNYFPYYPLDGHQSHIAVYWRTGGGRNKVHSHSAA